MALDAGDAAATAGMAKTIFDKVLPVLTNSTDYSNLSAADKTIIEDKWKKISHAISEGIIDHIIPNMEINGVKMNFDAPASNLFAEAIPIAQDGGAAINTKYQANAGAYSNKSTQSNDGTGLIA